MATLQSSPTSNAQPAQDLLATQRGIDTRLVAAASRWQIAKAAYDQTHSKPALDQLLRAEEELRRVRTAAADAAMQDYFRGV